MGISSFSSEKNPYLASLACEPCSESGPVTPVRGLPLIHLSQATPGSLRAEGCSLGVAEAGRGGGGCFKPGASGADKIIQGGGCTVPPPVLRTGTELEQQGPAGRVGGAHRTAGSWFFDLIAGVQNERRDVLHQIVLDENVHPDVLPLPPSLQSLTPVRLLEGLARGWVGTGLSL